MQGIIRLIITAEADIQDDRNNGQGWQLTRRWRREATETASAEMWQRGAERKIWRLAAAEGEAAKERSFNAYGKRMHMFGVE